MKMSSLLKKKKKLLKSAVYSIRNSKALDLALWVLLKHPKVFRLYRDKEITLLLDSSSLVDKTILKSGHWEKAQIRFLLDKYGEIKRRDAGNVFIDVGAYFGLYSLKALESQYFDEIHAFEPDTYNRYQLYANLFLNKAHNRIVVHQALVSDRAGIDVKTEASTSHPTGNRGGVGINSSAKESSGARTETLDNVFDFSGKNLCVKIDVEGHELQVLQGAIKLLKQNNSLIQVESFPEHRKAVFDLLQSHGFKHLKSIAVDHFFVRAA
jgi:FkbM family methyltransferase